MTIEPDPVPRDRVPRGVTVAAVGVVLLLVAVAAALTPWTSAPVVTDATGGLTPEQVTAAERFRGALLLPILGSTVVGVLVAAGFALSGVGRRSLARWTGPLRARPTAQALLVAVLVLVSVELVRLPFGAWAEHLLRAAGLSTRGWLGWGRDRLVQAGIETVLVLLLVLVLVTLARWLPRWWPAWASLVAAALVVVASAGYPLVVEPAFNDFQSLPAGQLRTDVLDAAAASGVPVEDVLVADASRRSTALNAYVSGIGPTRRVVVYDTLLTGMTEPQVLAVVAHELGHVRDRDLVRGTLIGALAVAAAVLVLGALLIRLGLGATRGHRERDGGGVSHLVAALVLATVLLPVLATPVQSLLSRQVERRADQHALTVARGADVLAAFRVLAVRNLADPSPPAAVQWWFGTHPSTAERVATAESVSTAGDR